MYGALCTQLNEFSFFKQKTAYEMRISDWSSDVCSSDLQSKGLALRPQVTTASVIACCCAGSFAAAKPRVASLCPASSLVTECTTTSAPCSKGRTPRGVVKVLSTTKTRPRSRASLEIGRASCRARVCQYV